MESQDPKTMSIKMLKAAIISSIGEKELQGKKFVEKGEFVKLLEELRSISDAKRQGVDLVPAGTYLLGDPCYLVKDVLDLETFNKSYYDSEEEDDNDFERKLRAAANESGSKKGEKEREVKIPRFDEATPVSAAFNTAKAAAGTWFGDNDGKYTFLVNSGVIALVPFSYNPGFKVDENEAQIVKFDYPVACSAKRGVLNFGDIIIDTKQSIATKSDEENNGEDDSRRKRKTRDKKERPHNEKHPRKRSKNDYEEEEEEVEYEGEESEEEAEWKSDDDDD